MIDSIPADHLADRAAVAKRVLESCRGCQFTGISDILTHLRAQGFPLDIHSDLKRIIAALETLRLEHRLTLSFACDPRLAIQISFPA